MPAKSKRGGARPGAGRPRRHTISEKEELEKARSLGRQNMLKVMEGWVALLSAPEGTNYSARINAAKEIADRCGFRFDPSEAPSDIGRALLEVFSKIDAKSSERGEE